MRMIKHCACFSENVKKRALMDSVASVEQSSGDSGAVPILGSNEFVLFSVFV